MSIRIVVADDQDVVRAGFAGDAPDGAEALRLCRAERPDIVLMDVRMPVMDGIEATRGIVAESDGDRPRVIMLTTFDLDEHV